MGLDISHDCWHGAYGAFTRWRDKLAEVAGYELAKIVGQFGETVLIDWGHITEANMYGDWDSTPADPLLIIIAHSDCDGWIRARDAGPLAGRLTELLPLLPDGSGGGHVGEWRETTQRFIDGLRVASAAGEDVEFY